MNGARHVRPPILLDEPEVKWTPIEGIEIDGKAGRIQVAGRAFTLKFEDSLDFVHALEKVGLVVGARMLAPTRRAAIVNRSLLKIDRVLAGPRTLIAEPPPEGFEDCHYLAVFTPLEKWEWWTLYLEDLYTVLHRMNRVLQGMRATPAARAVAEAFSPSVH